MGGRDLSSNARVNNERAKYALVNTTKSLSSNPHSTSCWLLCPLRPNSWGPTSKGIWAEKAQIPVQTEMDTAVKFKDNG